jgi:hypothetical protein
MTQAYNLSQFANKVNTSGLADLTTAVTGILPIANGGTGRSTLTANNVMLGNGTGAVQFVAPSTSGNALVSNGTTWISSTPAAPAALSTATGTAPSYSARAWVNFNGQGTIAIRGSANVSSISDNGTGAYVINFVDAMPDINFSCVGTVSAGSGHGAACFMTNLRSGSGSVNTTLTQPIFTSTDAGSSVDPAYCNAVILR